MHGKGGEWHALDWHFERGDGWGLCGGGTFAVRALAMGLLPCIPACAVPGMLSRRCSHLRARMSARHRAHSTSCAGMRVSPAGVPGGACWGVGGLLACSEC